MMTWKELMSEAMDAVRTLVCVLAPLAVPVVIGAFGLKW